MDGVVPFGEGSVDLDELQADQLQPALLEPAQDPPDEQALHGIRLHEDERPFVHVSSCWRNPPRIPSRPSAAAAAP